MLLELGKRYRCVADGGRRYNEVFVTDDKADYSLSNPMVRLTAISDGDTSRKVFIDRDYAKSQNIHDTYEPEFVPGQYYRVTSGKGPFGGYVLCEGTCFYVGPDDKTATITTPGADTLECLRDDNFGWYIGDMPTGTVTEKITAKEALGDLRVGDVFKLVTDKYSQMSCYHYVGGVYTITDISRDSLAVATKNPYGTTTFWAADSIYDTTKFTFVKRGRIVQRLCDTAPAQETTNTCTSEPCTSEPSVRPPQVGDKYRIVSGEWVTQAAGVGDVVTVARVTGQAAFLTVLGDGRTEHPAWYTRFDPNSIDYALEYISSSEPWTDAETEMEEAARITTTDRNDTYGDPAEDHARTGRMWGATLGIDDIPAETVALMMAQLKISREVHKPGRDNRVDMHGYIDNRRAILESKGQA